MKDLGERIGVNVDSNQKHVKDHTKPFDHSGDMSPKELAEKRKMEKALKPRKKVKGRMKKFSKIAKSLNIEKIPGSN